jgi:hypothetical protein
VSRCRTRTQTRAGEDVAEAAFTYAAGDTDTHRFRDRYVTWTCGGCGKLSREATTGHGLR